MSAGLVSPEASLLGLQGAIFWLCLYMVLPVYKCVADISMCLNFFFLYRHKSDSGAYLTGLILTYLLSLFFFFWVLLLASFLIFLNVYFSWRIIRILWWILPYIYESAIGIHVSPPSWTPLYLPLLSIPLSFHIAQALGTLLHASDLRW